jgi:hypothetical protein
MALRDNPRLPLTSGNTPVVNYTEMRNQTQTASTNINMTTIPSSPSPSQKKKFSIAINNNELRRMPTQQRRVAKKSLMANVGYRLAKRKALHIQR